MIHSQEITYVLKDTAKGTQSSAQYSLTLHNEWESFRTDSGKPPSNQEQYYPIRVAGTAIWIANHPDAVSNADATWNWNATVTVGLSIGGNLLFKPSDFLNFGITVTPSATASVSSGFSLKNQVPPGFHVYPMVRVFWKRNYYLVDHWDNSGFDRNTLRSDGAQEVWKDDGQMNAEPMFSSPKPLSDFSQGGNYADGTTGSNGS